MLSVLTGPIASSLSETCEAGLTATYLGKRKQYLDFRIRESGIWWSFVRWMTATPDKFWTLHMLQTYAVIIFSFQMARRDLWHRIRIHLA